MCPAYKSGWREYKTCEKGKKIILETIFVLKYVKKVGAFKKQKDFVKYKNNKKKKLKYYSGNTKTLR